MDRSQRRLVITRFVIAAALVNLAWFLFTLPRYRSEALALIAGAVGLYGQGTLFALVLLAGRRAAPAPVPRLPVSWRTLTAVAVGQPLIAFGSGAVMLSTKAYSHPAMTEVIITSASVLGGLLVAACLRRDTGVWAGRPALAMILAAAAWAALPLAISHGWSAGVFRTGLLGESSSRMFHPFVTAAWQIPMAGFVAVWLTSRSTSSEPAEVR